LRIVEIILTTNQKERFEEAYVMLLDFTEVFDKRTLFNNLLFDYYALGARLCFVMNKLSDAKQCADRALELAQIKEPQFPRHPKVGLVEASESQIDELKKIAEKD
jgi:hypothetical protein